MPKPKATPPQRQTLDSPSQERPQQDCFCPYRYSLTSRSHLPTPVTPCLPGLFLPLPEGSFLALHSLWSPFFFPVRSW